MNVICIKHKLYKGDRQPNLSCRICCRIFIEVAKQQAKLSKKKQKVVFRGRYENLDTKNPSFQ
jgi:hypothetical protein